MFKKVSKLLICILVILLSCKKKEQVVSSLPKKPELTLKIGDYYQGGLVFYLDKTGQHGMVYTHPDFLKDGYLRDIPWYQERMPNVMVGGTKPEIGMGMKNSLLIVEKFPNEVTAAKYCLDYVNAGYDDWYLPSVYELLELKRHFSLKTNRYLTSTEHCCNAGDVHVIAFGSSTSSPHGWKYMGGGVVAVRSF